jgi:hypothetical protein
MAAGRSRGSASGIRWPLRACNEEAVLATFKNNTWANGGTLEFPDGRRWLATTNLWATKYDVKSEAGLDLVSYERIGGLKGLSSTMTINSLAAQIAEMPWVLLFGWYLAVLMYMDSVAAPA